MACHLVGDCRPEVSERVGPTDHGGKLAVVDEFGLDLILDGLDRLRDGP